MLTIITITESIICHTDDCIGLKISLPAGFAVFYTLQIALSKIQISWHCPAETPQWLPILIKSKQLQIEYLVFDYLTPFFICHRSLII